MTPSRFALAIVFVAALPLAACSKSATPPTQPAAAPTPAAEPAAVQAATPATTGLDGPWEGSSGENMPLTFTVEGNQVKNVYVHLKARKDDGCNVFASLGSSGDAAMNGKSFTARGKHDAFEFTLNGTFSSDTEASGTVDWKTNSGVCGPYDTQLKWTAKKAKPEAPEAEDDAE